MDKGRLNLKASQVEPLRRTLAEDIWYWDGNNWVLRQEIECQIWDLLNQMFSQFGDVKDLVIRVCIVGSLTTLQYNRYSDLDLNIEVNRSKFKEYVGDIPEEDLYRYMMQGLIDWLEGMPIKGTNRMFSLHIYWYPFILASDNIYELKFNGRGRWIKGINFPKRGFEPDIAFEEIKYRVDELKRILMSLLNLGNKSVVRIYLKALEDFLKDWRTKRFRLVREGKGHFLAYKFSADWDTGNIVIKYLSEFAKPYKKLLMG